MAALNERLIHIEEISLEGDSKLGIPGLFSLLNRIAELADLLLQLLQIRV